MSYCRIGQPGSQVYAYCNGISYVTVLAGGHITFRDRGRKRFYDRLLNLRAAGVKVPKSAFTRLERELGFTQQRSENDHG